MRALVFLLVVASCCGCRDSSPSRQELPLSVPAAPSATVSRPNIIVIFTDDQGYADLGVHGFDRDIQTPHLDALATHGVLCTQGYVTAPQCVPSRAGLLTGRYQQRFGLDDNRDGPLPLEEQTIAELLQPAGYVCGHVGKWQLGQVPLRHRGPSPLNDDDDEPPEARPTGRHDPYLPHAQGFQEYLSGTMTHYIASHDLSGNPLRDRPEILVDRRFRIEVQTEAALSFIQRHTDEPFFLYLAYFAPHVPLESPEPWYARTPADLPPERRQALALLAAVDDGVGQIRELLRERQIADETLLIFLSDNGAPVSKGAWNGSLNTPWVGEKGMLTEGGLRVPFLLEWPGRLPAGAVYKEPVSSLDVAATALAAAGLPPDDRLDGVDLLPYLDGSQPGPPHEALFWRWRSQTAILHDGWKLIRVGDQHRYLFHLNSPEGERLNRWESEPRRAADLERRLNNWNATLPTPPVHDVHPQDRRFYQSHIE